MAARFEFRLQPLLDRRKRFEEEKQSNFAACRRAAEQCMDQLLQLSDDRRRFLKQLVETALTKPNADLRLRDAHLRCIEAAIDQTRRRREELNAACERAREELIAACRERRVIEKLKERLYRAYQSEQSRREELELDEANARCGDAARWKRLGARRAQRAAP